MIWKQRCVVRKTLRYTKVSMATLAEMTAVIRSIRTTFMKLKRSMTWVATSEKAV
jgi:hypothetical protein